MVVLSVLSMTQSGITNPMGAICSLSELRLVSLDFREKHMFNAAKGKLNTRMVKMWHEKRHDIRK